MRKPNPLQEDRGIHTRAGHSQERLFPPQQVTRTQDAPGKQVKQINIIFLANLGIF